MSWLIRKVPRPEPSERLFEPPEWDWAQAGDVGWWVRVDWRHALYAAIAVWGLRLMQDLKGVKTAFRRSGVARQFQRALRQRHRTVFPSSSNG